MNMRQIDIEFGADDLSDDGLRKLVAIYSHATGRDIRLGEVVFPDPIFVAHIDLDAISIGYRIRP